MGFEPTTSGTTIQCSAIELQAPCMPSNIIYVADQPGQGDLSRRWLGDRDSNPD